MTTTFQKRQKEMKRLDKQREKAAKRAQRKLDKRTGKDSPNGDPDIDHIELGPQRSEQLDSETQGDA